MSDRAAVAVVTEDGYEVGYADRNVPGYTPTTLGFGTYEEAKAAAEVINKDAFHLDAQAASEIVLSTMSMGASS